MGWDVVGGVECIFGGIFGGIVGGIVGSIVDDIVGGIHLYFQALF